MARCSFMERMALISALLASFFLCACSQFSCPLSGSMELAWSTPQGEDWINMTATLSSPTNWLSFGVIKPLLYMVPASEPHSVFLYSAGGYLGRYAMTAMDSSGFVGEAHASASVAAHSTGQQTFLHVNYSNSPAGYGVPLNIQGGNFLIWAHGGDWPSIHTNKGFVHVNWLKGTCVAVAQSEGVSPFAIFVTLLIILVFARTPFLHNTWPILWLRNTRLYYFTDYSVAGGLIILIHLIIVFSVLGSQIAVAGSTDQARVSATGIIAVMNLWMTLLPSSKSIVMFWLTSVPFERSMKYHQLLSSFTIFLAFIHLLYNATTNAGIFFSAEPTQAEVVPVLGFMGFVFMLLMAFFAFEPIRRYNYELFLALHFLSPLVILFIMLHAPVLQLGFIPGILLHVADIAIKLFNSFNSKNGRITSVGSLTKLVVEVPSSTAYENKVGGYLFIRVPAISAFEWHPFSLAHTEGNQLTFYIQSQRKGSWTHKLNSKASNGLGEGVPLSVSLEGPYGNLSLDLANYRSLNMIAGGIGITPFINILTCIRRDPRYSSVQQINVFWSMRGLDLLETFQKEIQSFMEAGSSQDTDATLKVFNTFNSQTETSSGVRLPNCSVTIGRMDLTTVMNDIKTSSRSACVLLCGPRPMIKEASALAVQLKIPFHTETFNY